MRFANACLRRMRCFHPKEIAEGIQMDTTSYDDIIHLPRPVSKKHPPMPMNKRAAQFLPFAALTGFEGEIAETVRLTQAAPELEEDALMALDGQLSLLRQRLSDQPEVTVTCFVPDEKKTGGHYETLTGSVRRLDEAGRALILTDGTKIDIDAIVELLV